MSKTEQQHREDLVRVCRMVYEKGWVAMNDGNVSIKLDDNRVLCTPTAISKGMVELDDVILCDLTGTKLSGKRECTSEIAMHINRIGIDYPVVIETSRQGQRKDSRHYKYRRKVDDKRKWGTPFYVLMDARDIETAAPDQPLARRVWTVSGEMVESEADAFIEKHLLTP